MHPWLQTLADSLVQLERFERQEHARLAGFDLNDRVQQGVSWSPVRVDDVQPQGRRWEVTVRGTLHDGISAGDKVRLGETTGRVTGVDPGIAELTLDAEPTGQETEVQRLFDPGTLVRYREALERVGESPLVSRLLEPIRGELPAPGPAVAGLNEAQSTALEWVLEQPHLALIHGPPGTGKTHLIVALLKRLVRDGDRPWALADSNAAVDHLAESARAGGLQVVRLGVLHRMKSGAAELSLPAWMARSPIAAALAVIERELSLVRSRRGNGRELGPLYDERRKLQAQAREWALAQAEIFATTLGTLAGLTTGEPRLPVPHTAVLDEATQALEPAVWCAARWVQRLVLVGDPHQLGPVVKQPGNLLGTSMLERLLRTEAAPMLEVQHRMHPTIQSLVEEVYGPSYRPHPANATRPPVGELPTVCFVDTAGAEAEERRDPVSRSLYNPVEIRLVGLALAQLTGVDVVVLAPYSAQVERLRRAFPKVTVDTINSFQGREADAVLLSFVRSNPEGELGFLQDDRRLTVALTRARQVLWMCGDSATLAGSPRFAALLETAADQGALQSVWEPPWSEALA